VQARNPQRYAANGNVTSANRINGESEPIAESSKNPILKRFYVMYCDNQCS